jgi:hypothetical protein
MTLIKQLSKACCRPQQQLFGLEPGATRLQGFKYLNIFKYLPLLLVLLVHVEGWGQGSETFTNLPTNSSTSYQSRSWTGDDNVTWTAEGARTDQTITGKAICWGNSGTRNVISPTYSGGIGNLTFKYSRAFTGTNARSIEVYVNNVKIGSTITVSPTSNNIITYSENINVSGNIVLEIRSTGSAQVKVDDISWTGFSPSTAPTGVTTGTAGSISAVGAIISSNNVTGDGGAAITERGVVYGTSETPTLDDNSKVTVAGTTGTFSATLGGLNNSTTYYVRAYATNSVGTTYGSQISFTTNAPAGSTASDISAAGGASFTTSNIDYSLYVNDGPLTSENSVRLVVFNIRDGGNVTLDDDAFSTTLTNLSLSLSGHPNLNRVALFDEDNNIVAGTETLAGATLTFNGLNIVAPDGGTKSFSVRASFNSTVTDNDQIQLTITSATAQAGGSLFAAGDAGGASSSTDGDINRIEVTATELNFVQQPTNTNINETMSPAVTVEAIDANNNRDLDFESSVSITSSGTLSGTPVSITAEEGLATFSTLTHTAAGTGLELSAASGALTGATSGSFDVVALQFINFDTDANWTGSGSLTSYSSSHSYSENNWSFTGGPALRNGTTAEDGFPGALGTYSWRLQNAAYSWTATYTSALVSGQKIKSVGFDVRRWDGSPSPNAVVEFSVNGGSSYTTATSFGSSGTIDNAGLSNSSNWSTFSHLVNTPTGLAANQFILRVSSSGGGERIMIDNFSYEFETVPPTITLSSPEQVVAATIATGATNQIISHFQAAVTDASATLNSLSFTTTGTYQGADVTENFQLWYGATDVFASADAIANVVAGAPGTFDFTGLTQQINQDATGYFWITADINNDATAERTLQVAANPTLTFETGTPTGTIAAGGLKTITNAVIAPTVVTATLSNITHNSVDTGGEVTANGNAAITAQGVVYGTSANPTLDNTVVSANVENNPYVINITGLNAETEYFLRAYATNSEQTGYSATEFNFTTLSAPSTVQASSLTASDVQLTSIELSFTGATFPGSGATEAGYVVLYNEGSAPTFSAANGEAPAAGTGNIFATSATVLPSTPATTINVTGLTSDTTYYFLVIPYTWDGSNAATYHYLTSSAPTVSESTLTPPSGWQITDSNTTFTIDFDTTVDGVNNGQFDGSGFTTNPATGQLNSNAWAVTGLEEGTLDFGGSQTSGDFAKGSFDIPVTSGGIYAFEVSPDNAALGVQPTSTDFTPGTFTLKIQNQTGSTVTNVLLDYVLYVLNNEARSNSFNFSYSTDNENYTAVSDLDYTSPEAADASPAWQSNSRTAYIENLSVPDEAFLYLRWFSDEVAGSGSRDEFALDDIQVKFNVQSTLYAFNGSWSPADPSGVALNIDTININSGNAVISSTTQCAGIHVTAGATLTVNNGVNVQVSDAIHLYSVSDNYAGLILDGTITGTINYYRYTNATGSGTTGGNDLVSPPLGGMSFEFFAGQNNEVLVNSDSFVYAYAPFDNQQGIYTNYNMGEHHSEELQPGKGYRAATVTDLPIDTDRTLTYTGTAATGNVDVTLTSYSGTYGSWNAIGNPYPSYISISDLLSHSTNISNLSENAQAIYGYDGAASDGWDVINLSNAGSRLMAPGQGFFVSVDGNTSMEFTPAMRRAGSGDDFIQGRNTQPVFVKLKASSATQSYSTSVYFNNAGSLGLDPGYDAQTWGGQSSGFILYSHLLADNQGVPMALQTLPETALNNSAVPLGINSGAGVQLRFSIAEIALPGGTMVYLEDRATGTFTLLNTSDYVVTPTAAVSGTGRFYLHFSADATLGVDNALGTDIDVYAPYKAGYIAVSGHVAPGARLQVFDMLGRTLLNTVLTPMVGTQHVDVSQLPAAPVIVKLTGTDNTKAVKMVLTH